MESKYFLIAERKILSAIIIPDKGKHAESCSARDEKSIP